MKQFTRFKALLLTLLCTVTAWATVPFTASTDTEEHWYELNTPLRDSRYLTSQGAGEGVIGVAHTGYARSMWKFVLRSDGSTYDIINRNDSSYLNPTAEYNTQITTTATQPSAGWTISAAATDGYYIVYSGTTQLNQTQSTLSYKVYSYGSGTNTSDSGCQYQITEVTTDPVEDPSENPFEVTTITDGAFAKTTRWYTLQIGASGYYISNPGTATSIALDSVSTKLADADLWCFTGNSKSGYRLYNKAEGAAKALAAPTTMSSDDNGGTSYVVLQDTASHDGYSIDWKFAVSSDLGDDVEGWYMYPVGSESNKVNNRSQKLAFWTGGADAGSTLQVLFAKQDLLVDMTTGTASKSGYFKTWTSNSADPLLTIDAGYNNMTTNGNNIVACPGMYKPQAYTIATSDGYVLVNYSFDYKSNNSSQPVTITIGDSVMTSTANVQSYASDSINDISTSITFNASGNAYGVALSNFYITVMRDLTANVVVSYDVFPMKSGMVCNRIPAIATASNGDLIAVADYRYDGADVGSANKIDLRARISHDNGHTWDDIFTFAAGQGSGSAAINQAYGDPCIVADRESSKVLVLCCAGNVGFGSGTRTSHLYCVSFLSEDYGQTWSGPTDITEQIYVPFDSSKAHGPIKSMFIGSGKIHQSRYTKIGDYYRLYCVAVFNNASNVHQNSVFYSDDFGATWNILGSVEDSPIPGGDEPKAEELPDGSVLLSSRCTGGRYFNIFTPTNIAKGEGQWGTVAFSGSSNNGTTALGNACNGEILIVPAIRIEDDAQVYVALQSVPLGSGRANVGIYYKELGSLSDFSSPSAFAANWDGKLQVSKLGSAYSTMCVQANDTIAFLYEEETYGVDYNIIYKPLSLEQITDGLYRLATASDNFDNAAIIAAYATDRKTAISANVGEYVGMYDAAKTEPILAVADAVIADPTIANYEKLNVAALNDSCRIIMQDGWRYSLRNKLYPTYYLSTSTSGFTGLTDNGEEQLFTVNAQEDGTWTLYNESAAKWLGKTGAVYSAIPQAAKSAAGTYSISSSTEGLSVLTCTNPSTSSGYYCPHLDSSNKLVEWTASADASQWYILPVEISTDIATIPAAELNNAGEVYYDLTGRRVANPTKGNIYVTNQRRKVLVK